MAVLDAVPDPEIPVLSIIDLGIVRGIADEPPRVLVSPTYTGCPATTTIENSIREALDEAGWHDVLVERVLFPPWTTAWISERGRQRLARLWHRPAERRCNRHLPAMRVNRHDRSQPLRRDPVQGAMALQRLPRAVRAIQVSLMRAAAFRLRRESRT